MSRRAADEAIKTGRVIVNGKTASLGQQVIEGDKVSLNNRAITPAVKIRTIMLNKPVGFVCSRNGQDNKTVYDILPKNLHNLKSVGRLDKDSSGLLLLTNDGQLAHQLTHPSFQKQKVYEVNLNKPLLPKDKQAIETGVRLEDGISKLGLQQLEISKQKLARPLIPNSSFLVTLSEGRNRQIRRTFAALNYKVTHLHRTQFGDYALGNLQSGTHRPV